MTPGARAAAAIEVLDWWLAGKGRAERLLREWGRANRYAGSKDRRAIQDIVYACLRCKRSYGWSNGGAGGRGLVIGHCLAEGVAPEQWFSGEGYAPSPLAVSETTDREQAPDPVRYNHPDWLEVPLKAALGADYPTAMTTLGERAPLDLRVNLLKTSRKTAQVRLAEDDIDAAPVPIAETALRAAAGARVLQTNAYLDGLIEIQDAASQAAALLTEASPGMAVLDFCAGGGGKTLALAAQMNNQGRLIAYDIAPERMKDIPARATRAGATIEIKSDLRALQGACDLVFVDAPCSGSGTWRREPEAKWALTPNRLDELCEMQRDAFATALTYVRPGGAIAYATCSVLDAENDDQVRYFEARYDTLTSEKRLHLTPGTASDGFFATRFRVT